MSGSVTEIADHDLAGRDPRQPLLLLRLGAAREQRLGEDLGPRDQAARRRERRARQLLGGEDHREVAHAVAAVLLGDRQAEVAELAHLGDEVARARARRGGGCARRAARPRPRRTGAPSRASSRRCRRRAATVVGAALLHHVAADRREGGVVRCAARTAGGSRRAERPFEAVVADAELVRMRLDLRRAACARPRRRTPPPWRSASRGDPATPGGVRGAAPRPRPPRSPRTPGARRAPARRRCPCRRRALRRGATAASMAARAARSDVVWCFRSPWRRGMYTARSTKPASRLTLDASGLSYIPRPSLEGDTAHGDSGSASSAPVRWASASRRRRPAPASTPPSWRRRRPARSTRSASKIEKQLQKDVEKRQAHRRRQRRAARAPRAGRTHLHDLADVDLVIESIVEELPVKRDHFAPARRRREGRRHLRHQHLDADGGRARRGDQARRSASSASTSSTRCTR